MGKFDRIFAQRADPRPAEAPPAFRLITPAMKSILLGEDGDDRVPARRFVALSQSEASRHAETPWPMWVEVRKGSDVVRRTLWAAPNKTAWIAANHNDPAPSDQELITASWHRTGGAQVEIGATE